MSDEESQHTILQNQTSYSLKRDKNNPITLKYLNKKASNLIRQPNDFDNTQNVKSSFAKRKTSQISELMHKRLCGDINNQQYINRLRAQKTLKKEQNQQDHLVHEEGEVSFQEDSFADEMHPEEEQKMR
jgi:hypothetical protein